MKILTILLISFITVFSAIAHAGPDSSEDTVAQQAQPRLANCKDCISAGYRRGFAAGEAAAMINLPTSSSVTTPSGYRKSVYVQAPSTQPQLVKAVQTPQQPPRITQATLSSQPALPKPIQAKYKATPRIQQSAHHAGHGHHTQAQILDCELTDSLNRQAKPVTTIISTKKHDQPVSKPQHTPARKPKPVMHTAAIKHDDHYHHTAVEKADCALTDALNRMSGPVSRVINSSPYNNQSQINHPTKTYSHGSHNHHSEVERADCALTDALNRRGSIVSMLRKH